MVSVSNDNAKIVSADGKELSFTANGRAVKASDVVLNVTAEKNADVFVGEAVKAVSDINAAASVKAVYDITLTSGNVKVQPNGDVQVTVAAPGISDAKNVKVFYISDGGEAAEMEVVSCENGSVTFVTDHFSRYAVVEYESDDVSSAAGITASSEEISVPAQRNGIFTWTAVIMLAAALAMGIRAIVKQ